MSDEKNMTFDMKIEELQEERSQLDLSFLEGQKEEYEKRIAELLESPVEEGEDAFSKFNEAQKCYAKLKEIKDKINNIPENAEETIEEIDRKIQFYKKKREESKNLPLYRDTEEGLADVFGSDIIQYAKETNNTELMDKLKNRSLTPEEYSKILDQDHRKHDEMEKMYNELFSSEESKPSENGNYLEDKNPSEGDNQIEKDENLPKKKRKIEKPKDTLSKLDIEYQTVDGIILPTRGNTQTIRRSKAVPQKYIESDQDYEDKINILFSKVLTPDNGFQSENYNVVAGMESKHMVRKTTYVIVEIPNKNKMIILNNGYGEVSFLCDEIFERSLLTSVSKEELVKQHGESIKKLEFRDEETWVDEVLGWLGKNEKFELEGESTLMVEDIEGLGHEVEELQDHGIEKSGEIIEGKGAAVDFGKKTETKLQQMEDEESEHKEGIEGLKIPDYKNKKLRDKFIENNLTKDDFEKFNDEIDLLVCRLMEKDWQNFVLRNENLERIQREFFEWANKNKKLKISFDKWIDSKRATIQVWDALKLFMKSYFVDKTKKVSKLRETINDDLYNSLKEHLSSLQESWESLSEDEKKKNQSEVFGIKLAMVVDVAIKEKAREYKDNLKPGTLITNFDSYYKLEDLLGIYNDCREKKDENEKNNKMEELIRKMHEFDMISNEDVRTFLKLLYEKKILDSNDIEDEVKGNLVRYMNEKTKNFNVKNLSGKFIPTLRIIDPYKFYVEVFEKLGFELEFKNKPLSSEKEVASNSENNTDVKEEEETIDEIKTIDDLVSYYKTKGAKINDSDLSVFLNALNLENKDMDSERVMKGMERNKHFSFHRLKEVISLGVLRDKIQEDENVISEFEKENYDVGEINEFRKETEEGHLKRFKYILRLFGCEEKYITEIDKLNARFPGAVECYINKRIEKGTFSAINYGTGVFDFSVMQAGILSEAVEMSTNDVINRDMIKDIFRYLGFYVYEGCDLEILNKENVGSVKTSLLGIIGYLSGNLKGNVGNEGEKQGCFGNKYYNNEKGWNKFKFKNPDCKYINFKNNSEKASILAHKQTNRLGLIYKGGYYMVVKLLKHEQWDTERYNGWLDEDVSEKEANAFLSATGVKIKAK